MQAQQDITPFLPNCNSNTMTLNPHRSHSSDHTSSRHHNRMLNDESSHSRNKQHMKEHSHIQTIDSSSSAFQRRPSYSRDGHTG